MCIRRLRSLVPPPHSHLVRYHGVFALNPCWRRQVVVRSNARMTSAGHVGAGCVQAVYLGMARPKNPQETRQRLLAAADEVFYAHGIRTSSVDEVAQRAGLTKRTLYYHFPSKDELAAAYVQQRSDLTLARQI